MNLHMKQMLMAKTHPLIGIQGYLIFLADKLEQMREEVLNGKDVSSDIRQIQDHELEYADLLLEDYIRS